VVEGGGDSGGVFLPSLLSSVSLLNPFSVFRCSLSLFCSSSSSSVLLALMVAGWRWQLLGSPMTAAVLLLHGAATLTSVSSSSGLSFPRQLFSSPLLLPFLPLFFRASFSFFFLFKFAGGGVCFSLKLSSLSTSPLFFSSL